MSNNIIDNYEEIEYKIGDDDKYTGEEIVYDCKIYYKNGLRHRDNDLPAIKCLSGAKYWYNNGKLHRETIDENGQVLPAIEFSSGNEYWFRWWYKNGQRHRDEIDENGEDLPAYKDKHGNKIWFKNGEEYLPNKK